MTPHHRTTQILLDLTDGRESAADELLPLVYDELRGLAADHLQRERPDHTLQPTALVHEAYLRLVEQTRADWKSKAHFFAVAATVIRRILVDHSRQHKAQKRGRDWQRITLSDVEKTFAEGHVDLLALDEALQRLEKLHERQARVVQLRYFAGLTTDETALVLGVARSTVAEDWAVAKAWLASELTSEGA